MKLQVLSTSDSHTFWWASNIIDRDAVKPYGLFRAASTMAVVEQMAKVRGDFVLKIENGDFIQGSPLGTYLANVAVDKSAVFKKMPQEMGYDARVLGNHEFNFGRAYLEHIFKDDESLLNANVLDEETGLPFIGKAYNIFEKKGKKVAVIGLTTKYVPNWERPENIPGLLFEDPVKIARDLVKKLSKQVDAVIIAYHGGFSRDLDTNELLEKETGENQGNELLEIPGVSALVTGHQHRLLSGVYKGIPISQPGYRAEAVGQLTVDLDADRNQKASDTTKCPSARLIKTADWPEKAKYVNEMAGIKADLDQWLDQVIAHLATDLILENIPKARQEGHDFVDLINQVQLETTGADLSATALFNDEMPGFHRAVTRRELLGNYPFPNTLVSISLTGEQLKTALEVNAGYFSLQDDAIKVSQAYQYPKKQDYNYDLWSGLVYRFDLTMPLGQRVVIETVNGQPYDPKKTYTVAVNNYRATGAGNEVFSKGKVIKDYPKPLTTLLADYLEKHDGLVIEKQHNFHIDK
ncbi:bifunctional metallophosphatase/5'-nucleotidase [Fructobacillus sp. M1-13]|uniref:Bifunctional metallophosphatase/5'-nucleotidase n=1 Tax=Fructobacillus papyriferae TaxID=2713171 RepID=A0ABS5QS23_9LACO|nr:bifunctional UDP-sugar hydrolase/5'-nucleotidase [Fructobacillus papyriferae]MBS9335270.1 bifunctional metallophosphatase/5'-nucleotidase [Fructobacillus papyriferae]MCD2159061.1 bifunctional metallophosphatase/5'-nucleotidase [Fructobacillus papyriferae]